MKHLLSLAVAASLFTSVCLGAVAETGDVAVNDGNFPDKAFRKGILSSEYVYDRNGDGVISVSEQKKFQDIEIYDGGITNAKGIELFPHLAGLTLPNNKLEKLNLRGNTKLTSLDVQNNRLSTLDVSSCPKLTWLEAQDNRLKSLILGNTPDLEVLIVRNNKLTDLNVTGRKKLIQLCCEGNGIKWLEIDGCTKLIALVKKELPHREGSAVSWGTEALTIDKDTILTIDGKAVYTPEMWPFISESDLFGVGFLPDVVVKSAKAYSDKDRKHSIGTIPAYTAVKVRRIEGSSSCEVTGFGNQNCYVSSSVLWGPKAPSRSWTYKKLSKSTKAYQQPDYLSTSVTLKSKTNIAIVSERNGWYLIRAVNNDYDFYCFIPAV